MSRDGEEEGPGRTRRCGGPGAITLISRNDVTLAPGR
jgi:hypothetical protein